MVSQKKEVVMAETRFTIEGMSCQHCVMAVRKALAATPGVIKSDVQIGTAVIEYDGATVKPDDMKKQIEKAGYRVTG